LGGKRSTGLTKQKVALKEKKPQINGKFNDISSADEKITKYHCRAFI
jgi:hypothetical protein